MAGTSERISSIADLTSIQKEKDTIEAWIDGMAKKIVDFNKQSINIEAKLSGATNLKDVVTNSQQLVDVQGKLVSTTAAYNKTIQEYIQLKAQYNGSTKDIISSTKELSALKAQESRATQEQSKANLAAIREEMAAKKLQTQNEKDAAKASQLARGEAKLLVNDYELLKKVYNDTAAKAKEYLATLGLTHPVAIAAADDAKKLNSVLLGIEAAVGQNQRNVGNYASGFNGLSMSIQQILREAPSAAVSLNTFFLAISNNLPIFFDEIQKINKAQKEANALLQEQIVITRESATAQALAAGATEAAAAAEADLAVKTLEANAAAKAAPSLLRQIGKSLFSVNTLLTLAVLALTLFGGKIVELIEKIFKGNDALNQMKQATETLNKALASTDYAKVVEQVSDLKENVRLAKDGFIDKEKVVRKYNETIGQTTGEVKNLSQVEDFLVKNADAYLKMMLYKTAATLSLNDAAKKLIEQQKNIDKIDATDSLYAKIAKGATNPDAKGAYQDLVTAGEKRKEYLEKKADKELDIFRRFQQKAAEIAKANKFDFFSGTENPDDPKKTKDKPDHAQQEFQGQKELNDAVAELRKQQIEQDIAANEEVFQDTKQSLADRLLAYQNYQSDKIYRAEEVKKNEIANADAELKAIEKLQNDGKAKDQEQLNDLTARHAAALTKKQIAEEKYQATVAQVTTKGAKDIVAITKNSVDEQRKVREEGFTGEKQTIEQGYATETLALQQKYLDGKISTADYEAAIKGLHTQNLLDLAQADIDFYTAEKNRSDLELKDKIVAAQKEIDAEKRKNDILAALRLELLKQSKANNKELEDAVISTTENIIKAALAAQSKRNDEESKGIDEQSQREIDAVNRSAATQQEKADKTKAIQDRAQREKEVLDQKNKALAKEQAEIEAAAALIRVATSTFEKVAAIQAQAAVLTSNPVTAALAPLAYSQIPIVIATGAIAEAGILAELALAKYKDGIDDVPADGPAIVGDGNRSEIIIGADGTRRITPAVPTITYLNKHDQVVPSVEEYIRMTYGLTMQGMGVLPAYKEGSDNKEMVRELKEIKSVIKNNRNNTVVKISTNDRDYLNTQVYS